MKKIIIPIICLIVGQVLMFFIVNKRYNLERPLPKPQLSEGLRGKYGIDKNINEKTIDKAYELGDGNKEYELINIK